MKRMIAALVCLLLAVSLLAGCTPSEQKLLVGKWTGKADLAEAYETLLAKADPTLTGHIDIEDFQVELTLEFHESGTYQITADPEDLEAVSGIGPQTLTGFREMLDMTVKEREN